MDDLAILTQLGAGGVLLWAVLYAVRFVLDALGKWPHKPDPRGVEQLERLVSIQERQIDQMGDFAVLLRDIHSQSSRLEGMDHSMRASREAQREALPLIRKTYSHLRELREKS